MIIIIGVYCKTNQQCHCKRFMIKDGDIGQGWNGEGITTSAGPKWNNEPNFSWAVNYFKYAQDLDFDYQKYLQNVVLIQEFLKSRNQKYLFVNTFDMWTDLYPNAQARIARNSHLVDQIDQDYFLALLLSRDNQEVVLQAFPAQEISWNTCLWQAYVNLLSLRQFLRLSYLRQQSTNILGLLQRALEVPQLCEVCH